MPLHWDQRSVWSCLLRHWFLLVGFFLFEKKNCLPFCTILAQVRCWWLGPFHAKHVHNYWAMAPLQVHHCKALAGFYCSSFPIHEHTLMLFWICDLNPRSTVVLTVQQHMHQIMLVSAPPRKLVTNWKSHLAYLGCWSTVAKNCNYFVSGQWQEKMFPEFYLWSRWISVNLNFQSQARRVDNQSRCDWKLHFHSSPTLYVFAWRI